MSSTPTIPDITEVDVSADGYNFLYDPKDLTWFVSYGIPSPWSSDEENIWLHVKANFNGEYADWSAEIEDIFGKTPAISRCYPHKGRLSAYAIAYKYCLDREFPDGYIKTVGPP